MARLKAMLKDVFGSLLFSIDYIYTYVAGSQQANRNNRSPCSFFPEKHLCKEFWLYLDIFKLLLIKS